MVCKLQEYLKKYKIESAVKAMTLKCLDEVRRRYEGILMDILEIDENGKCWSDRTKVKRQNFWLVSLSSRGSIGRSHFIETVSLLDQSSLQDDSALLVPLLLFHGELVHPAQLLFALLAVDVANPVTTGQHHAFSWLTATNVLSG